MMTSTGFVYGGISYENTFILQCYCWRTNINGSEHVGASAEHRIPVASFWCSTIIDLYSECPR